MPQKILQLIKYYKSNAPLLNDMARSRTGEFETVTCYLGGYDDGKNQMGDAAKKVIYKEIPKRKLYWSSWSTIKALAAVIDENNIDLVVCQFRRVIPIGVAAIFLSKRKPKAIAVLHGIVGGKNSFLRKLINFFTYKRLDRIVSVSEFGVADIINQNIGLDNHDITAVPNGLNCEGFNQPVAISRAELFPHYQESEFLFVMVGRLAPVKNHVRVLHAMFKLKEVEPSARLLIAGRGPVENQLKILVDELNLTSEVEFLGFRTDIPDILKVADAYLMPSAREGLPMALMEAMVSSLPVVTSDRTGMRELVPDESIGYLVDPDSIDSICQGMLKAVKDKPESRQQKIINAKERILEKYSNDVMIESYEKLYRDILK